MKYKLEVELENPFETREFRQWIKNAIEYPILRKFKVKKLKIETVKQLFSLPNNFNNFKDGK